jgi:hypothetical protein
MMHPWMHQGTNPSPPPRPLLLCSAISLPACDTPGMKTFRVVPRGKKYWIEEVGEDGAHRVVVGFPTEEAALRCLRDLQARPEDADG